MKEPITIRDVCIICILCTGTGALLSWLFFYGSERIGPLKPFDAPAWIQGVGSLVAIGIAIYVPWRQRQNGLLDDSRKERAKAIVMSTALLPAMEDTRASLKTAFEYLDKPFEQRNSLSRAFLQRHVEYDQFRADLYLLGDLGRTVNRAISYQHYFLDCIDIIGTDPNLPASFCQRFTSEVNDALAALQFCIDELKIISEWKH